MMQYKKAPWLGKSIVAFALILNLILIKTAYTGNADLYWLLIASIPLLSIGIYISWQTNRLRHKHFFDSQQFDFKWPLQTAYAKQAEKIDLSISFGNDQCRKPFKASIFNMKPTINMPNGESVFQSLNVNKIDNPKNSEQERLCTYSLGNGLVWQIRPDYSGCRSENGHFSREKFKQISGLHEIKMIELIIPSINKAKCPVDSSFAIEETPVTKRNNSNFEEAGYSNFTEPEGMVHFLDSLRILSGGKPIGIRLCIDNKKDFYKICYSIRKTNFIPDFIVVEGSVTNNRVTYLEQKSYTDMPLYEALQFVSATLQHYSLENKIKLIAAGEIVSDFEILKILALGADSVYCEMDNYDTINNSPKEYEFRKDKTIPDIYNKHIPDIIKIMQAAGFRKISDITLPNLFRSMESFPGFNNPVLYQGSIKNIYVSKLNTSTIKNERKKEHIA